MSVFNTLKRYLLGEFLCPYDVAKKYGTTKIDARIRLEMLAEDGYLRQIKHDVFLPNTTAYESKDIAQAFTCEFDDLRDDDTVEPIRPWQFE